MTNFKPLVPGKVSEEYIDFLLENTPYRIRGADTRPFLKEHFLTGVTLHRFVKDNVYWATMNRQVEKLQKQHIIFCESAQLTADYIE